MQYKSNVRVMFDHFTLNIVSSDGDQDVLRRQWIISELCSL